MTEPGVRGLPFAEWERRELSRRQAQERLRADALRQLRRRGYDVPLGPVRMVVGRKIR